MLVKPSLVGDLQVPPQPSPPTARAGAMPAPATQWLAAGGLARLHTSAMQHGLGVSLAASDCEYKSVWLPGLQLHIRSAVLLRLRHCATLERIVHFVETRLLRISAALTSCRRCCDQQQRA